MASTIANGNTGAVTMPAGLIPSTSYGTIDKWTASFDGDLEEITSFTDTGWFKVHTLAMHGATGTIEGQMAAAAVPDLANFAVADRTGVTGLVLTSSTGESYSMKAFLHNISSDVSKAGLPRFTANFTATGTITRTTTA